MSQPFHSLPGPENIFRAVTANGITVLARANPNSPSIALGGFFQAGSLFDSDEKLGLADFTSAALMRGTDQRDFFQIHDALESIGAGLGFSSGARTTSFSGRSLAEDLPLIFELLADAVRNPSFPPEQVERLRAQLLTGLSIREQDTGDRASMAFDEIVYANHPYRRPDDGYPETIQAIQREDLIQFRDRHYGPRGMVLAVVGAIEPLQVLEMVERFLGDWQNPDQPHHPALPALQLLDAVTREHVSLAGKSQTDLVIGCHGPTRLAEDYFAASLANSVLGQFGMMGRIGEVVRERSGLAYYAYSSLSAGLETGTWDIGAGVSPANLQKAIDLILQEIAVFVENGVTAEELRDSQDNFIGRLPLSLESNGGVANALLNIERYQLGLDYYQTYESRIRAVTPEDALQAIRRHLHPGRLAIVSAG
ncbi:MAG: insulinase family protein [Chloroflexi bacterium HGW-Chloroflexi-6]|nr:MAG: insulinase family protein [Chloroflexi bacterium HGW-Chloroflexi-6]